MPILWREWLRLKVDPRGLSVMDCCHPIRPFRTKLGRSCCRTWSTSASATWGWSSYQRKGEMFPEGCNRSPQGDAQLWPALSKPLNALVSSAKCFSVFRNNITKVDFCLVCLQGDLHWVQEWHAQYFSHRPELHKGGTDWVLWNRQGEILSCMCSSREHVHPCLWESKKLLPLFMWNNDARLYKNRYFAGYLTCRWIHVIADIHVVDFRFGVCFGYRKPITFIWVCSWMS